MPATADRVERRDMNRVVREEEMTCRECARYYDIDDLDDRDRCPACRGEEQPADDTTTDPEPEPEIGDRVVAVDSSGARFTGELFYKTSWEDRGHSGPTCNVVLVNNRGGGSSSFMQVLDRYPDAIDPDVPFGEIRDKWMGRHFLRLVSIRSIHRIGEVPVLRPCDGIYLLTHPNTPVDDGGLRDELPPRGERLIDRAAVVLHRYDDDPDCYEVWTVTTGYRYRINVNTTRFVRTFRATSRDWCADRRRPVLALARYMASEYENDRREDAEAGVI